MFNIDLMNVGGSIATSCYNYLHEPFFAGGGNVACPLAPAPAGSLNGPLEGVGAEKEGVNAFFVFEELDVYP